MNEVEKRVEELEQICKELHNALADANDYDSVAEMEDHANFRHRRGYFDNLLTRAGRILHRK